MSIRNLTEQEVSQVAGGVVPTQFASVDTTLTVSSLTLDIGKLRCPCRILCRIICHISCYIVKPVLTTQL